MSKAKIVINLTIMYAAFLIAYFWEEGVHLLPNPTHWWWYALSAFLFGYNFGQLRSEHQNRKLYKAITMEFELVPITTERRND